MPFAMVAPPSTLALIEEMLWPFLYFYSVSNPINRAYLIGPSFLATDDTKLASSTNTTRLTKNDVRMPRPHHNDNRVCISGSRLSTDPQRTLYP